MLTARTRLSIFVTHPVQYHVPLWRALARDPRVDSKVFYFSDHGVRGGIDKGFGVNVAWDVDLLSGYEHEFISRDIPVDRLSEARIADVDSLLRSEAPDYIMVCGYMHKFERQLVLAAKRHRAKALLRAEFSDLSFGSRSLAKRIARSAYLKWFYGRVDHFCYPGEHGREHLLRHHVPPERMFFSPYSVDAAQLVNQKGQLSREAARAELGLADHEFTFILSGKLIPRKNPFAVLEAIRGLSDTSTIALIVLGDGELRQPFCESARALLGRRFIFPGFVNQSQLGRYFLAADALVMPSLHETWGLVVNEAMHYGLPCIVSTQVGCAPDLVLAGRTGWVYPSNDIGSLTRYMRAMVDAPSTARQMGERAAERVACYSVPFSAAGVLQAVGIESEADRRAHQQRQ